MNLNDLLGRMAKRTKRQSIYSERSWVNPTNEVNIERVNIRPRRFLFYII